MIRITNLRYANVAVPTDKEFMTYGKKLTAQEEHQVCVIIGKALMNYNISAQISTNALYLPEEMN